MSEFVDSYAEVLSEAAGISLAVGDEDQILELAREVAHGTERKNAPLATFLAGAYVGTKLAAGFSASDSAAEAVGAARRLLPS